MLKKIRIPEKATVDCIILLKDLLNVQKFPGKRYMLLLFHDKSNCLVKFQNAYLRVIYYFFFNFGFL